MFTLGKYVFQLDDEASELDGGYLMFTIYKRNVKDKHSLHNISVLIHSKTYEVEPFFFYYGNKFGIFNTTAIKHDDVDKIWYLGEDKDKWKFAIPKADKVSDCILELPTSRESALTLVKVICTIRDNYDEYVNKINKELVDFLL